MKLDLGAGTRKKEGFTGVDSRHFEGVDVVCNLGRDPWPWENSSVDEVNCSHMVEHLTATERIHFFNELCRVLKPSAKAAIITPHWASSRAYGDPTHQWPAFSEFALYYLNAEWRIANAPHTDAKHWDTGYTCDFDATWGYNLHPALEFRNQAYKNDAVSFFKEAAQDLIASLTKREQK